MAVDDKNVVDAISIGADSKCYLIISDHLDWENPQEHLQVFQDKLNDYLNFVESGQLNAEYDNHLNQTIVFQIIAKYPIPEEIYKLTYPKIVEALNQVNLEFIWKILDEIAT